MTAGLWNIRREFGKYNLTRYTGLSIDRVDELLGLTAHKDDITFDEDDEPGGRADAARQSARARQADKLADGFVMLDNDEDLSDADPFQDLATLGNGAERDLLYRELHDALRTLPEEEFDVVQAVYFDSMSILAASKHFCHSPNWIRTRLARAMKALKKEML